MRTTIVMSMTGPVLIVAAILVHPISSELVQFACVAISARLVLVDQQPVNVQPPGLLNRVGVSSEDEISSVAEVLSLSVAL